MKPSTFRYMLKTRWGVDEFKQSGSTGEDTETDNEEEDEEEDEEDGSEDTWTDDSDGTMSDMGIYDGWNSDGDSYRGGW